MTHVEILAWLRENDPARLDRLWREADEIRRVSVGDEVHLRGLVEISNHCARLCTYCGLRAERQSLDRYRMTEREILDCARQAAALGYGALVLQSGEDPSITGSWMADLIRRVKRETPLAVTLSLGERRPDELAAWRTAGADRYLLKFETSNRCLYERIHPLREGGSPDRIALLRLLRGLGYEVGSGVMIGIPGQTYDDLARDVELFRDLDLDMIGVGPYLPHPDTPLARPEWGPSLADGRQVPATDLMTHKVVALARLACPGANIPATTALAVAVGEEGRGLALMRGANVIMPDLTPPAYRRLYEIYPGRGAPQDSPEVCAARLRAQIESLGRRVGRGRGDSRRM
ncbi:MAG TPA: [FeFe] hydrogenase H-cluster radical SAM maturase HydE [Thermoguttaceae bacterium]|nr:[FeFe] hydrogenase H-cluster radical SAM maturase HydE [Thermoguttaceae bacterium]